MVYDVTKIDSNPRIFQDNKIKEFVFKCDGVSGNGQRNYALNKIINPNTFIILLRWR